MPRAECDDEDQTTKAGLVLGWDSGGRARSRRTERRRERCKQQPEDGVSGCGEEGEARDGRRQTADSRQQTADSRRETVKRDRHSVVRSSEVGRSSSA